MKNFEKGRSQDESENVVRHINHNRSDILPFLSFNQFVLELCVM